MGVIPPARMSQIRLRDGKSAMRGDRSKPSSAKRGTFPEFLGGLLLALFGSLVILESRKLALGNLRAPGPAFFPFLLGCLVTIVSLILLVGFSLGKVESRGGQWKEVHWQKVVLSFASLLVYSLTLESIGYVLGTFLLSGFLFFLMEKKGILLTLGVSGVVSLGFYFLFKHVLFIQLPKGIIPF